MDFRRFGGVVAAALALLGTVSMSACGEAQQTKTVTVSAAARETPATPHPSTKPDGDLGGGQTTPRRSTTVLTACDANVRVKAATTTCSFAENVFYEYWRWLEYGEVTDIKAFSSALRAFLPVNCDQDDAVVCRTSAGALVRFPLSAVKAYTLDNAAQYARNHRVTKGPNRANEAPVPPSEDDEATVPPSEDDSDCDPSYEGACLDANSSDYDCEGGSGDGPDYTGTVTVVGDDHFDLDRDGDGVGCQS